MSIPTEALADALEASGDVSEGVSVYGGPALQIAAPAIVIRPADPWMEPDRYCGNKQRYYAIAVVSAAAPRDGMSTLYAIIHGIIAALDDVAGWDWETVGAPVIDESTGTAFLAAQVRLVYSNGE